MSSASIDMFGNVWSKEDRIAWNENANYDLLKKSAMTYINSPQQYGNYHKNGQKKLLLKPIDDIFNFLILIESTNMTSIALGKFLFDLK